MTRAKKLDASLGLCVVDWLGMGVSWVGMDDQEEGGGPSPTELLAIGDEAERLGRHVAWLVHWDDPRQLSVHDRAGWVAEVFED